jgi:anti-anti-sigma factor
MNAGQILVADHDGVFVIKLIGDVRLTLCISFDQFIDSMFADEHFASVMFDLTEAQAIDSTTLGLMAKISILAQERKQIIPVVVSTSPSINRLLGSMGFADIFHILHDFDAGQMSPKPTSQRGFSAAEELDETRVKEKVLEAHRVLMSLNEANRETFRDLIETLENI